MLYLFLLKNNNAEFCKDEFPPQLGFTGATELSGRRLQVSWKSRLVSDDNRTFIQLVVAGELWSGKKVLLIARKVFRLKVAMSRN